MKDLFLGLGESLVGKTCGFLGLGKIGLATARRQKKQKKQMAQKSKTKYRTCWFTLSLARCGQNSQLTDTFFAIRTNCEWQTCIQASAFWNLKTDLHKPQPEWACFWGNCLLVAAALGKHSKKKIRDYLGIFPNMGGGSSQFPKLLLFYHGPKKTLKTPLRCFKGPLNFF